jgi:hypothetical protein
MSLIRKLPMRTWVLLVLLIGVGIGGYAIGRRAAATPPDRAAYRAHDLIQDGWLAEYQQARATGAAWVYDPIALGLRSAGYPNEDQIQPDQVSIFYPAPDRMTLIVLAEGGHDDSVAARELRIDLIREPAAWRIEWLGGRYRCVRDITFGWTTGLCS